MLNRVSSRDSHRLLCFSTAGETYCVDFDVVCSIERIDLLQLNPASDGPSGWLLGRRTEIPVFSLAERLNLSEQDRSPHGRIIVFQTKQGPWGLLVERVLRVVNADSRDIHPMPTDGCDQTANLFKGIFKAGEDFILYLEVEQLHPSAPLIQVEKVHRRVDPRARHTAGDAAFTAGRLILFSTHNIDSEGSEIIFGLSVTQVLQVVDALPLTSLASSSPHAVGIVNWRGLPVPLIDLNACLGLKRYALTEYGRMIIARATGGLELIAFAVNPKVRTLDLPIPCKPSSRPLGLNASLIKAAFELDDRLLILPDLDRIIADPPQCDATSISTENTTLPV